MDETHPSSAKGLTLGDLRLMAYAQHMAQTAQSEAARRLFETYVEHEMHWLRARETPMKAIVDQALCTGCGLCPETCPEVFEMQAGAARVKVNPVPAALESLCREAMKDCPVGAIAVET